MCGIAAVVARLGLQLNVEQLRKKIERRGQDGFGEAEVEIPDGQVVLMASLLHIQGKEATVQPLETDGGLLLWNGEVFDGIDMECSQSDTICVAGLVQRALMTTTDHVQALQALAAAMAQIQGPYAFIYYSTSMQALFYGRDPIGRRSLVVGLCGQSLAVSSVVGGGEGTEWREVPVDGLFCLELQQSSTLQPPLFHPWPPHCTKLTRNLWSTAAIVVGRERAAQQLLQRLDDAMSRRVGRASFRDINLQTSAIAVLFSGGIDSLLLAALLHRALSPTLAIELVNVIFCAEDARLAPDRLAAIAGLDELKRACPGRQWQLVHVDVSAEERRQYESHIRELLQPLDTHMDLNIGTAFWFASRGQGYLRDYSSADAQKVLLETIDSRPLLRLGTEDFRRSVGGKELNPEQAIELASGTCSRPSCRRPAKVGCLHSSCKRCCDESFASQLLADGRFVVEQKIIGSFRGNDCPTHKTKSKHFEKILTNLLRRAEKSGALQALDCETKLEEEAKEPEESREHPDIEVDTGLTEEEGVERAETHPPYRSSCKVLLVGIGADEQLAGYARHRTAFSAGGWQAMVEEMNVDLDRLWRRNLGRDDRCISDHSRESWYPYLDEEVVRFIQSLPMDEIADLTAGQGVGDKRILRDVARLLGLNSGSSLVKRAIQFGSLAAKQTSEQYFGSKRKCKGTSKI